MPFLRVLARRFLGLDGPQGWTTIQTQVQGDFSRPAAPAEAGGYPGDYTGPVSPYGPLAEGAGPGEVVWAHVPFEEDHSRGKDRPTLVVGQDGGWLLGLPMTSQDHDRDEEQERRAGRHWIDVGAGAWDSLGRRSEARVDRIVRLDPATVRREGGAVTPEVYEAVVHAIDAVSRGLAYDDDPV